jgi:hypothetical protein
LLVHSEREREEGEGEEEARDDGFIGWYPSSFTETVDIGDLEVSYLEV